MGALPKRKYSKARQGKRRNHLGISPPALVNCPQCNSPKLPHHVCPTCGSYDGKETVTIKSPAPKSS
ncbi:50S ribosomal protein L32 [Chloroflexota bacterium]